MRLGQRGVLESLKIFKAQLEAAVRRFEAAPTDVGAKKLITIAGYMAQDLKDLPAGNEKKEYEAYRAWGHNIGTRFLAGENWIAGSLNRAHVIVANESLTLNMALAQVLGGRATSTMKILAVTAVVGVGLALLGYLRRR